MDAFFEIAPGTIEKYQKQHEAELQKNLLKRES
jgi:hypothetical protein